MPAKAKDKIFFPKKLYSICDRKFEHAFILSRADYLLRKAQKKQEADKIQEGKPWFYSSAVGFSDYLNKEGIDITPKQVRSSFSYLTKKGYLFKHPKGFNKKKYDKTSWYTYGENRDEYKDCFPEPKKPLPQKAKGLAQTGEPIPYPTETTSSLKETIYMSSFSKPETDTTDLISIQLPDGKRLSLRRSQVQEWLANWADYEAGTSSKVYVGSGVYLSREELEKLSAQKNRS